MTFMCKIYFSAITNLKVQNFDNSILTPEKVKAM